MSSYLDPILPVCGGGKPTLFWLFPALLLGIKFAKKVAQSLWCVPVSKFNFGYFLRIKELSNVVLSVWFDVLCMTRESVGMLPISASCFDIKCCHFLAFLIYFIQWVDRLCSSQRWFSSTNWKHWMTWQLTYRLVRWWYKADDARPGMEAEC